MNHNPFKIIEPRESVPDNLKNEVMGSVKSVVLILRFIQLFVGDYSNTLLGLYRTKKDKGTGNDDNK